MHHKQQTFSRWITLLVILTQVLAGVSGALPTQGALAASAAPRLERTGKPTTASVPASKRAVAAHPVKAAPAAGAASAWQVATRQLVESAAASNAPEVVRPVRPQSVAAAPLAQAALAIGNTVWKDLDGNGMQDSGEPGIPGVTVGLYDSSGNPVLCPQASSANLALKQPATQSSTYPGAYDASKAVDGNTASGSGEAVTQNTLNSWWQVDLGQLAVLRQVVIYPRADGVGHDQAENIYVEISNQPFASTDLQTTLKDPNVWSSPVQGAWTGASLTVAVPNYMGRYVRIQHSNQYFLALGEVQVFGSLFVPVTTVTDASGHYSFTDANCLKPNTNYAVRIATQQTALFGLHLGGADAGGVTSNNPTDDDTDSDATSVTSSNTVYAQIELTSPAGGVNDSYDFGFAPLEIGNYVWQDTNANGVQDSGEPGIPGVTISLYDSGGNPVMCRQVGNYDTYADAFNNGLKNGSTGSLTWGTSWSFAGKAAATTTQGNPDGSMAVYGDTTSIALRTVDLSVFAAPPTLSFDYIRGNGATSFNVQYSSNGGTSFTTLATLSVNNASYQTITYTLPITVANAQIRLQGATGGILLYAYFDNFIIRGQQRFPVTAVTDSNGLYTFTGANCVEPSTNYQMRIDKTQAPLMGLLLTKANAGGVTNNDPTGDDSDSDASSVTISGKPNAVIDFTSPVWMNDSYDFGFAPLEIGDTVWKDLNDNGVQDSGEPGIPGVTVGLYDDSGNAVHCPQTSSANLALKQPATQSGDYQAGYEASKAVDGDTTGTKSATLFTLNSWWQVDLGQSTVLRQVVIYPRTDGFHYQAENIYVEVSNQPFASTALQATLNDPNVWSLEQKAWTGASLTVAVPNYLGRYVRIQHSNQEILAFGEVQVFGDPSPAVTAVTDASGHYTFTGFNCLQPSTKYKMRIATDQTALPGLNLTRANAGGVTSNNPKDDATDSDATSVTISNTLYAQIGLISPDAWVNESYDFGFVPLEIGNTVWKDTNANGLQESGEPGIPGVTVGLYDSSGNPVRCLQPSSANLALKQSATQSTDLTSVYPASNAVDGNTGGVPAITQNLANSWWQVDLGQSATLRQVVIYPRTDSFHKQTEYIYVQASDQRFTSTALNATLTDPNVWSSPEQQAWTGASLTVTVPSYVGRYVRIQHSNADFLALSEVQVFGDPSPTLTTVTDSNGHYAFTAADCLQPNKQYQVRIDTLQTPLVGSFLTKQNAGGTTSNDPTLDDQDSDASSVMLSGKLNAVINATSPATGANYSYDFGFAPNMGAIIVSKATIPAGNSQTFGFTSDVPSYLSFTLRDGASYTMTQVLVGVYAVTETLPSGWTRVASTCTNANGVSSGADAIQVTQAITTTCTILNALQPTTSNVLTVTKSVNWNGNTPNAGQNFNINITGPSFPGGKADTIKAGQTKIYTNVVAGIYTVTETSPSAGWVTTYSAPSGVVSMVTPVAATTAAGPISGTVFLDYNSDGVYVGTGEPGVAGVIVTAYDPNGVARGSAATDANGKYSFTPTGSGPYRLELTNLPVESYPSTHGTDNGTSTQFVTTNGGARNVNFGVNYPGAYCQNNPMLCTPVMIAGDPANASTGVFSALQKWSYAAANGSVTPTNLANDSLVGTVWGLAYARQADKLYSAAFLKRHAGLGPGGLGAIYVTNNPRAGAGVSTTLFFDVANIPSVALGTVPSNYDRGLTTPSGDALDNDVFDKVGKVGLGDIDISDDESMLWTVSLNDKKLIGLPISNPSAATAHVYAIPDPGCKAGSGDYRPFGLKYYHGFLYLGVTCDASLSLNRNDLKAVVYRFDPANSSAGFMNVLNVPLNYTKGAANQGCTSNRGVQWYPWVDTAHLNTFNFDCGGGVAKLLPQPLLSDLEFDLDGSLILGFMDRFSHQAASGLAVGTNTGEVFPGGDILRAWNNKGSFVLENNGTAGPVSGGVNNNQGPGGGEFYQGDFSGGMSFASENANGGLAFLPGSGEVVSTVWDPFKNDAHRGVTFFSNTTGNANRRHDLGYDALFGKGSGIGDLELLCDSAPLEIGNRVWKDLNGNGVQDPGEPSIANVTVSLQSPTNTVTTNTDANGLYYFTVSPNTAYTITINPSQTALNGLSLTRANMQAISGNPASNDVILDTRDSDAVTVNGKATIFYRTGLAGQNNHGLDFGWSPALAGKLMITNKAPQMDWGDDPAQYNTTLTNTGAAHIIVPGLHLGASEDTEVDGQPSSGADGDGADEDGVQFPTLTVGSTALLTVTATNTGTTVATLYGWIDFNGDGQFTASERVTKTVPAGTINGVFSLPYSVPANAVKNTYARFRLSTDPAAAQPTGVARDGEVEDYLVTIQGKPIVQFGDRVWLESDADGLASTGVITPVAGLVITATNTGSGVVYTTTTNPIGYYSFTLPVATYTVRYGSVPASYGPVTPSSTPGGNRENGNAGTYAASGNPDQSHANNTTVTLATGEANWLVDFAFHAPQADLQLVKQVDKAVVKSGDTAVYTLVLTNNGPDTVTNIQLQDLLPAKVLYQSAKAQQGSYDATTGVWTVGTLAANSSVTLTITVKIR